MNGDVTLSFWHQNRTFSMIKNVRINHYTHFTASKMVLKLVSQELLIVTFQVLIYSALLKKKQSLTLNKMFKICVHLNQKVYVQIICIDVHRVNAERIKKTARINHLAHLALSFVKTSPVFFKKTNVQSSINAHRDSLNALTNNVWKMWTYVPQEKPVMIRPVLYVQMVHVLKMSFIAKSQEIVLQD